MPCILRWPNHLPEKTVSDQVALTMDLSASIVRIAGAKMPADRPFDGLDVLERLEKNQPLLPRTVFWRARRGSETWWAVRESTYKYVARQGGARKEEYLFARDRDPGEKADLLAQHPEDVARLKRLLAEWETKVLPRR